MTAFAGMLASAESFSSGCLLDRKIVPDGTDLTLVIPPAIIENDQTMPLPGSMLVAHGSSQDFTVAVFRSPSAPLEARWWVDRSPHCDPTVNPLDCNGLESSFQTLPATDAGYMRIATFTARVTTPGCHHIDLYLSGLFHDDDTQQNEPIVAGDIAHARWFYVVTPHTDGTPVTASECSQ